MSGEVVFLGLGSNLGDRARAIAFAIRSLDATSGISVRALSAVRETEPVGPPGQSFFLNAAAAVETTLEPRELLEVCMAIEAAFGRDRSKEPNWGPRTLDIDVLLFGERIIDEPGLQVPHPRLHERSFVLEPLAEIGPDLVHPVLGRSIECLRDASLGRV